MPMSCQGWGDGGNFTSLFQLSSSVEEGLFYLKL